MQEIKKPAVFQLALLEAHRRINAAQIFKPATMQTHLKLLKQKAGKNARKKEPEILTLIVLF